MNVMIVGFLNFCLVSYYMQEMKLDVLAKNDMKILGELLCTLSRYDFSLKYS